MISVIKNLKKENEFLKGKCENSDIALVKLIEEVMNASQKANCAKSELETRAFDSYATLPFF